MNDGLSVCLFVSSSIWINWAKKKTNQCTKWFNDWLTCFFLLLDLLRCLLSQAGKKCRKQRSGGRGVVGRWAIQAKLFAFIHSFINSVFLIIVIIIISIITAGPGNSDSVAPFVQRETILNILEWPLRSHEYFFFSGIEGE